MLYDRNIEWLQRRRHRYVNAVAAAGGYVPYARAHRKKLAAIFTPKFPQLPEEVVPTIIEFWAHVGHY